MVLTACGSDALNKISAPTDADLLKGKRDTTHRVDTTTVTPPPDTTTVTPPDTTTTTPPPPTTTLTTTAALPQVYINSTAPVAPAAGRVIISVPQGGNLQAALNTAQPGDVIELAAGATFTGNFTLPNKNTTSTSWIVIRPSNWASLPAAGVRMTPTKAAALALPKIVTPNTNNAILTALGAHHYRLMGLDVSVTPTNTYSYAAIALDGGYYQTTMASVVHDFVLDRMYVHGLPGLTLRRCVAMNSAWTAIVDSWISECHEKGSDSQAIASWNGPGPFKIVNNYLEGAGENIMFGGSDPSIPNMTPTDIEIRRNHITKPTTWTGGVWSVKNLMEIKHGRRILVEGNIFENSWQESQNGVAIVVKTVNQGGQCTWCVTEDVTIRYNTIKNVGAGFNIAGAPDNVSPCPCIPARRITVNDNIISNMNVAPFLGDGRGFATYGSVTYVVLAHNTMISPTSSAYVLGPAGTTQLNFTAKDNLTGGGVYGLIGDNWSGAKAFSVYAPGGVFAGNVTIMPNSSWMPLGNGNTYPTSIAAVGFANATAGDFHLLSTSPYKLKATDGRDPGADIDGVNNAIAGVRVAP